jgi:hypothetical protein
LPTPTCFSLTAGSRALLDDDPCNDGTTARPVCPAGTTCVKKTATSYSCTCDGDDDIDDKNPGLCNGEQGRTSTRVGLSGASRVK